MSETTKTGTTYPTVVLLNDHEYNLILNYYNKKDP